MGSRAPQGMLYKIQLLMFNIYLLTYFFNTQTKRVPIAPIKRNCSKFCCKETFLPITVSFARTLHTCQGMNVGPDKDIKQAVVDPGARNFEILNPGVLYTLLTRFTKGSETPEKGDSPIYFMGGDNFCLERFINMTKGKSDKQKEYAEYEKVKKRKLWMAFLDKNRHNGLDLTIQKQRKFLEDLEKNPRNPKILEERLHRHNNTS